MSSGRSIDNLMVYQLKDRVPFEALKARAIGINDCLNRSLLYDFETNYDVECTLRRLNEIKNLFLSEPPNNHMKKLPQLISATNLIQIKNAIQQKQLSLQEVLDAIAFLEESLLEAMKRRLSLFEKIPLLSANKLTNIDHHEDQMFFYLYTFKNLINFLKKYISDSSEKIIMYSHLFALEHKFLFLKENNIVALGIPDNKINIERSMSDMFDNSLSISEVREASVCEVKANNQSSSVTSETITENKPQSFNIASPVTNSKSLLYRVGVVVFSLVVGALVGLGLGLILCVITGFASLPIAMGIGILLGAGVGFKMTRSPSSSVASSVIESEKASTPTLQVPILESTAKILKYSNIHQMEEKKGVTTSMEVIKQSPLSPTPTPIPKPTTPNGEEHSTSLSSFKFC